MVDLVFAFNISKTKKLRNGSGMTFLARAGKTNEWMR